MSKDSTASENRTVSPTLGDKRNRSDDDEEEDTSRRVLQRKEESPVVKDEIDITACKAAIHKIVLHDLWHPKMAEDKNKAMIQLLDETHDENEAVHAAKQDYFYSIGGPLAVAKAMSSHPTLPVFQEYGIKVFVSATYKNNTLKVAIANIGGIEIILAAMANFPTVHAITTNALKALSNLTMISSNAEILANNPKDVSLILEKLVEYKDDDTIVLWACRTIQKLAAVESLCKTLFEAGTLSALSAVIESHKNPSLIRKVADETLVSMAEYLKSQA